MTILRHTNGFLQTNVFLIRKLKLVSNLELRGGQVPLPELQPLPIIVLGANFCWLVRVEGNFHVCLGSSLLSSSHTFTQIDSRVCLFRANYLVKLAFQSWYWNHIIQDIGIMSPFRIECSSQHILKYIVVV